MDAATPVAQRLAWARRQLPLTRWALDTLPTLTGVRLACTCHVDDKIAVAVLGLLERGAEVFLAAPSAQTTRDDVVDYLARSGATTHAWRGMSEPERLHGIELALTWGATHTCEMGGEISLTASRAGYRNLRGGLEATRTGVHRLALVAPEYPVFNWDHVPIKSGLHNRYAVGQGTWIAFVNRTQLSLQGLVVVIIGFGPVGQGLADVARSLGADVVVVEADPVRRLVATYDGWPTSALDDALPGADVVVTSTGRPGVLSGERLGRLRDGCFLLNSGHAEEEIDLAALGPRREVIPYVDSCRVAEKEILLFAGGAPANLTAGFGDTLNSFDVTLAIMVRGIGHLIENGATATPGVQLLPPAAWMPVAERAVAERAAGRQGFAHRLAGSAHEVGGRSTRPGE